MVNVRSPHLVGREPEMAALQAHLAAARERRGGAVFVSGEPGIGKSRLARELAGLARADGVAVCSGRAVPGAEGAAYRPLAEALAQALRGRDLPDQPALLPWLPVLRVMFPALGSGPSAGEASPHTCGEALLQLLRQVPGGQPLLLVLEDLHWADPDTLGVLEYLADNLAGEPVLCLATLRPDPITEALALARRTDQRGTAAHLPLGRLDQPAVAELVTACRPDAPDELVARVREVADGVPLLVEELLATHGVPASVGEAVRTRVAQLGQDDRAVLYAAAVLGRDVDWELLPAATGRPLAAVIAALERMVAAMLLTVSEDGFRFRHALTREAVVAGLVPPRRRAIAQAALAALDAARPGHDQADLALLAGDPARGGAMLAAAGRAALRRGALGTAVATLRRAADLLGPAGAGQVRADLVAALALAGRLDEALAVGEDLLAQLGTGSPGPTAAIHPAAVHLELARAAIAATRWPTAVAHLDAAKGLLAARPDPALAGQGQVLGAEVALATGDLAAARAGAGAALAAAEPAGAAELACHALELIGRSHRMHDLAAAQAAFQQAYRTADAADLAVWRLRAQHELGTIELLDHAGTDALLAARAAAEQLGAPSTAVTVDAQLAATYLVRFELATAHAHADRAVAQARRLRLGRMQAVALVFLAEAAALRGDRATSAELAAQARRAGPDDAEIDGFGWSLAGAYELFWGDRAAAVAALDQGMAALHTVPGSAPSHYRGLWALLHAAEGRPDADGCAARVRESGATVQRANRGYLAYAEAVRTGAVDPVMAGDADLAYVPVWHQVGRLLVAEAALAGGWGTPQPWLREARDCFDRYGLDRLARHCARLLGDPPQPAGRALAGVTPREAEVLALVAAGLANKQVAARLQLSVRTVEKHVESLLRKTGAQSRTQLVAMLGEST